MLFKVLMNCALDNNRTLTTMCCNNLATLEVHIGVMNSNIKVFKWYVMNNRAALKNRGHDINEGDMLEHILNAYLLAQDNKFHAYITQIKTGINEGLVQHTEEQLTSTRLGKTKKHGANNSQNISRLLLSQLSSRS